MLKLQHKSSTTQHAFLYKCILLNHASMLLDFHTL